MDHPAAYGLFYPVQHYDSPRRTGDTIHQQHQHEICAYFGRLVSDHEVFSTAIISTPFYLGKYTLTQEQWVTGMESNPSFFKGRQSRRQLILLCQALPVRQAGL